MTTRTRVLLAPATAAAVLLGVTGCSAGTSSGGGATTSPASSKSPAQSQSSASHSASPAPSQSPSPSHSATTTSAAPKLVKVKHYTYVALPGELKGTVSTLLDSGTFTAVSGKGVTAGSQRDVEAAVILAHYNPALTKRLDKASLKLVLDSAAKGGAAFAGPHAKTARLVLAGTPVRLISTDDGALLATYERGGLLVEIFGSSKAVVLKFATAYFAAGG